MFKEVKPMNSEGNRKDGMDMEEVSGREEEGNDVIIF